MNLEKLNSDGYRLPCNAEHYVKEPAWHEIMNQKNAKSEREKDEKKAKEFSQAFDPSPYLKYLHKTDKDKDENSMMVTGSIVQTNRSGVNATNKLPKII